ncbi:MAG: hypothetical protein LBM20_03100 [Rikenellaceae bacterium]|jgi:hypothetical protein|nr:hypothetical protein [Rikenellaceae bacterium]
MRHKPIILSLTLALLASGAAAQTTIQREVDVTRAYEPSVQNALKMSILPDMTDTTQMRPQFNYQITPRPLESGFALTPLTPARMTTLDQPIRQPFYAKIGAGYSLQSVADLRYARPLSERVDVGAYASHRGRWGKIENDMRVKESAQATDNRAGAFLDWKAAERLIVNTDINYGFQSVNRYGYFGPVADQPRFDLSENALKQFYHNPSAKVSLGSDFIDPDRFQYRATGGMDYVAERFKYDQLRWDGAAQVAFRAGQGGVVTIGGDAALTGGQNNLKGFESQIVQGEVAFRFDGNGLRLRLAAGLGSTTTTQGEGSEKQAQTLFLPQLTLEKEFSAGKLTPYLGLHSTITDNSFGELLKRNPYTFSGTWAPNTVSYRARAGVKGTLGSFSYNVYGRYDRLRDNFYWVNTQEYSSFGNAFGVLVDTLTVFGVGVELQANILNTLTLTGAFNYSGYSSENYETPGGLPAIKADFSAAYHYRDRLNLTLGLAFVGERTMYEEYGSALHSHVVPGQVDLQFGADYFINRQFGVFVQLQNLLNQRLYTFNRYRELGMNGTIGIKLSF